MTEFTMIIGDKNLSSWSMRPWLMLRALEVPFEEVVIFLDRPDTRKRILRHSPAGKVPILKHGATTVWESLAILEYLADIFPGRGVWPDEPARRARARALACEMHGGFAPMRKELPMDCCARLPLPDLSEEAAANVARIKALWADALAAPRDGDFLFGRFGAVDAMYGPVVSRFVTYGVELEPALAAYRDAMMDHPAMRDWFAGAEKEVAGRG